MACTVLLIGVNYLNQCESGYFWSTLIKDWAPFFKNRAAFDKNWAAFDKNWATSDNNWATFDNNWAFLCQYMVTLFPIYFSTF